MTPLAAAEGLTRGRELSRLRASTSGGSPAPAWLSKEGGNAASHLAAWRGQRGFALDITAFDGADTLSSKVPATSLHRASTSSCERSNGS